MKGSMKDIDAYLEAVPRHRGQRIQPCIAPAGCEPDLDELQDQETETFFTARGIEPAMDYGARIQAASGAHPDFDAWLSSELDAPG